MIVIGASSRIDRRDSLLIASQAVLTQSSLAGNFTVGGIATIPSDIVIDGYLLLWTPALASETVKISIWDGANTLITASVASKTITHSGIHYLNLTTPLSLAAGTYTLGCRETSGTRYQRTNSAAFVDARDYGNGMILSTQKLYAVGDARPSLDAGTERYGYFAARQIIT